MPPKPEIADFVPLTEVDISRYFVDYMQVCPGEEEFALGIYRNPDLSLGAKADIFIGMSAQALVQQMEDTIREQIKTSEVTKVMSRKPVHFILRHLFTGLGYLPRH